MPRHRTIAVAATAALTLWCGEIVGIEATGEPAPPRAADTTAIRPLREYRKEARTYWDRLVTVDDVSSRSADSARGAIARMLSTAHGVELITKLHARLLDPATGKPRTSITVRFVDHISSRQDHSYGAFQPVAPDAEHYEIFVRWRRSRLHSDPTIFMFGEYPDNSSCSFVYFYREPSSIMAQTLYHELLHVWFVNAFADDGSRRFPSGHGRVMHCEFEKDFLDLLRSHAVELSIIEGHPPPRIRRVRNLRGLEPRLPMVSPVGSTLPSLDDTGVSD